MKIIIANSVDSSLINGLGRGNHELRYAPNIQPEKLDKTVDEFDIVIVRDKDIHNQPKIAIIRAGAGVENIKNKEIYTEKGIPICNTPGNGLVNMGNSNAVAEMILAALYLSRKNAGLIKKESPLLGKIVENRNLLKVVDDLNAKIDRPKMEYRGDEVFTTSADHNQSLQQLSVDSPFAGQKIGIISGTSAVAKIVAFYAKKLGMEVYMQGRSVDKEAVEAQGYKYCSSIAEIAEKCDVVSVHTSLVKETERSIGKDFLEKFKGTLINFARPGLVDKEAMKELLSQGAIKYIVDGKLNEVESFLEYKNALCFPHLGAETHQAQQNVANQALGIVKELANGELNAFNCINPDFAKNSDIKLNPASKEHNFDPFKNYKSSVISSHYSASNLGGTSKALKA